MTRLYVKIESEHFPLHFNVQRLALAVVQICITDSRLDTGWCCCCFHFQVSEGFSFTIAAEQTDANRSTWSDKMVMFPWSLQYNTCSYAMIMSPGEAAWTKNKDSVRMHSTPQIILIFCFLKFNRQNLMRKLFECVRAAKCHKLNMTHGEQQGFLLTFVHVLDDRQRMI